MNKKDKKSILYSFVDFAFTRDIDVLDYKILADHFVDQEEKEEEDDEEDMQVYIDRAMEKLNTS